MPILPFIFDGREVAPRIGAMAWIAPDAWVIGDAEIGAKCSILFGAVVRGDVLSITVGDETNIQDGAIIHTTNNLTATKIGRRVTIGHRAVIHGATIGDEVLIGMGATVLDGAEIGAGSIVGAHALVTKGCKFPARSLILGSPAKLIRTISEQEYEANLASADHYVTKGAEYLRIFNSEAG